MIPKQQNEGGFSLIEILASIVILSVASLTMMAFFNNAMSYNKGNQNKTVLVNIARNVLVYMEKQDFSTMKTYFTEHPTISSADCLNECTDNIKALFYNPESLSGILKPLINNKLYDVSITYQKNISISNPKLNDFLLPIIVKVSNQSNPSNSNHKQSEVEGYITHESIR